MNILKNGTSNRAGSHRKNVLYMKADADKLT